jgi:transcriptional regulator with XRE-family HTH domain
MDDTGERTTAAPTTVGAQLRTAREARGQTLEDIGKQTRIPVRLLVQIEDGRLEGMPAAPYSAGFVKSYARAVDLDPIALSQEFRAELARSASSAPRATYEPYEPADPVRLPPRLLAFVALAIAILLVAGYGIWRSGILTGEGPDARARLAANGDATGASDATAAPVAATAAAPAPAPVGGAVRLTALKPVWFNVSERHGATLFTGTLDQGKSWDVPATAADPVIRTGKPEGLSVTVGGQPVAPLGAPAEHIADVSLKPDALRNRAATGAATPAPVAVAASTDAPTHRRATHARSRSSDDSTATAPATAASDDGSTPSAFRAADGNAATPQTQP